MLGTFIPFCVMLFYISLLHSPTRFYLFGSIVVGVSLTVHFDN